MEPTNLSLIIESQNLLWAECDTNAAALAPLPVNLHFLFLLLLCHKALPYPLLRTPQLPYYGAFKRHTQNDNIPYLIYSLKTYHCQPLNMKILIHYIIEPRLKRKSGECGVSCWPCPGYEMLEIMTGPFLGVNVGWKGGHFSTERETFNPRVNTFIII